MKKIIIIIIIIKKNNKKYKKNENKVEKIPNIFNEKNINNVEINNLNSDYKNGIFVFEKKKYR